MAKAVSTLEDNGTDEVTVKVSFDPTLSEEHAAHRLAAEMLAAAQALDDPLEAE